MVALPAVWLANRDDGTSTRPNVAAVGAPVAAGAPTTTAVAVDPMGDVAPGFLGSAAPAGEHAAPVTLAGHVGIGGGRVVATVSAVFRRSIGDPDTCVFSGVPAGTRVTVVNVANDRAVECWTAPRPLGEPQDELVMSAAAFGTIADPTTGRIHVEIRQG